MHSFYRRRGASTVEYGLLLGLLAVAIITVITATGGRVSDLLWTAANRIEPEPVAVPPDQPPAEPEEPGEEDSGSSDTIAWITPAGFGDVASPSQRQFNISLSGGVASVALVEHADIAQADSVMFEDYNAYVAQPSAYGVPDAVYIVNITGTGLHRFTLRATGDDGSSLTRVFSFNAVAGPDCSNPGGTMTFDFPRSQFVPIFYRTTATDSAETDYLPLTCSFAEPPPAGFAVEAGSYTNLQSGNTQQGCALAVGDADAGTMPPPGNYTLVIRGTHAASGTSCDYTQQAVVP